MPRGKNYVNNNKGVFLKASNKKKGPAMETCYYGASCTRKDCIYRHDVKPSTSPVAKPQRSTEPCMAFLAGVCTFTAETCRKRHPASNQERQELKAQFQRTPCRYGAHCKTNGCLFLHPSSAPDAFPPLPGAAMLPVAPVASAWRPAPIRTVAPPPKPAVSQKPPTQSELTKSPNNLNINAKAFVPGGGWS